MQLLLQVTLFALLLVHITSAVPANSGKGGKGSVRIQRPVVPAYRQSPGYYMSIYKLNQCSAVGDYACQASVHNPLQVRCIPSRLKCDGVAQCPLGDDEINCPPKPVTVTETVRVDIATTVVPTFIVSGSTSMVSSLTSTIVYSGFGQVTNGQTLPMGATVCLNTSVITNATSFASAVKVIDTLVTTVHLTKDVTIACTPTQLTSSTTIIGR